MNTRLISIDKDDEEFEIDKTTKFGVQPMKTNNASIGPQFMYLGKLTNKQHFRAFVYSDEGEQLADSYDEYEKLVASGLWFSSKEELEESKVKPKHVKHKHAKPEKAEAEKVDVEEVIVAQPLIAKELKDGANS